MPALRSSSVVAEHTTANSVYTAPASTASGDWLVIYQFLFLVSVGGNPTATPPTGFVAAPGTWPQRVTNLAGNQNIAEYMWIKQAGGSEPSTYTVTHIALGAARGLMFAVSGADPTTPMTPALTQNIASSNTTTTTFLGLTTTVANQLIVICAADDNDNGATLVAPTGSTPTFTIGVNDAAGNFMASGVLASAGATGNKTMTNNSAPSSTAFGFVSAMLAFQPPTGGVTGSDSVATISDAATRAVIGFARTATDSVSIADGASLPGGAMVSIPAWFDELLVPNEWFDELVQPTAWFDALMALGPQQYGRATSDAITVSDTASRAAQALGRTASDSVTVSDGTARVAGVAKTAADTVTVSDTATRAPASRIRSGTDTTSVSDTASRAAYARTRSSTDTVTVGDSAAGLKVILRTTADSFSVSDAASRAAQALSRAASDTVSVADTTTRAAMAATRAAADAWSVTDLTTRAPGARPRSSSDAWTVADFVILGGAKVGLDTWAVGDSATRQMSVSKAAGDTWSGTDQARRAAVGLARFALDVVVIADQGKSLPIRVGASDATTVSDVAVGVYHSVGGVLRVDVTESVAGLSWTWSVASLGVSESEAGITIIEED